MKKRLTWSLTTVTCATLALGTALPAQASSATATSGVAASAAASGPSAKVVPAGSTLSPQGRATLDAILAQLPADWRSRRDALLARADIEYSPAREILDRSVANAIDPGDYVGSATPLDGYVDQILSGVSVDSLIILSLTGVLDLPSYGAVYYGSPKDPAFALPTAYAGVLTQTFGYAQRFWDVKLEDIELMAMHGQMTVDLARMTRMVKLFHGLDDAEAVKTARQLIGVVRGDPGLQNGRNPIFTLNAFAFSAEGETDPTVRRLKDKMVFGDGILAALKALGLPSLRLAAKVEKVLPQLVASDAPKVPAVPAA